MLDTPIVPPCASIASRQKVRPSPVLSWPECAFPLTRPNFSEDAVKIFWGMPKPVSATSITKCVLVPDIKARRSIWMPAGVCLMALESRFSSTPHQPEIDLEGGRSSSASIWMRLPSCDSQALISSAQSASISRGTNGLYFEI